MKLLTKQIQQHFDGFLQTPCLWKNSGVYELKQFKIEPKSTAINLEVDEKLRLGKYIERFVSFQLQQEIGIEIISENIQIQQGKITLGELDCLLLKDKKPIHLEIIYKFYMYDYTVGNTEIEHFTGPNRKDSLTEKLTKLKKKQLPLLYSNQCKTYLESIKLDVSKIEQQVYFKAQLFVPFTNQQVKLSILNQDCIAGFYINKEELQQFKDCKFYIPNKKDWLVIPHSNINWNNFDEFQLEFNNYVEREFSPMCWMKKPNGEIFKIFVVWW
jgi:hypothetical protein